MLCWENPTSNIRVGAWLQTLFIKLLGRESCLVIPWCRKYMTIPHGCRLCPSWQSREESNTVTTGVDILLLRTARLLWYWLIQVDRSNPFHSLFWQTQLQRRIFLNLQKKFLLTGKVKTPVHVPRNIQSNSTPVYNQREHHSCLIWLYLLCSSYM